MRKTRRPGDTNGAGGGTNSKAGSADDNNSSSGGAGASNSAANNQMATAVVERPRKKLSFREPEIMGYYMQMKQGVTSRLLRKSKNSKGKGAAAESPTKNGGTDVIGETLEENQPLTPSDDDLELENQAMRVVRTVGQAFEVCHKLSINGPPPGEEDNDGETPHSESDVAEKIRKDLLSDPISCDNLTANESTSTLDALSDAIVTSTSPLQPQLQRPNRLEINPLPPPPSSNNIHSNPCRRSPHSAGEIYSSSLTEPLKGGLESSMPSNGTPLSNHHELQLLREQLDQQSQQTHSALAQAHLFRDRLATETAARLESQAREHQLLVNNKELLEHITTLVALLQLQERSGFQNTPQNISNLPQMSPGSKVARWFEALQPLSRPESGFVDSHDPENEEQVLAVLSDRLSHKKRKKLFGLKKGKVTTF